MKEFWERCVEESPGKCVGKKRKDETKCMEKGVQVEEKFVAETPSLEKRRMPLTLRGEGLSLWGQVRLSQAP